MSARLPAPENERSYPALDGLRGVAVLLVFTRHYFIYPEGYRWGWIGVQIFFVLSGFLITGILYDTRHAENKLRVFYARRALRIFPLYYAVLIAGWALWALFRWQFHPGWLLAPVYLTNYTRFIWNHDFLQMSGTLEHLRSNVYARPPFFLFYGHFWSLSVEEQFYLVWPVVVYGVRNRKTLLDICVIAVWAVPALRLLCIAFLPTGLIAAEFVDRVTPCQCDSLLLGAALALAIRGPQRRVRGAGLFLFGPLAVFLSVQAVYYHRHGAFYVANAAGAAFGSIGFSVVNLFAAGLLLLAIDSKTAVFRVLNVRFLRWLGTISYGFYVFHDIPHMAYERLAAKLPGGASDRYGIMAGVLAFGGTLALATLSFHFLERPFLRLKSRFVARDPVPQALQP